MIPVYCIFYFFMLLQLAHVYQELPPQIATHYDAYGTPVTWISMKQFIAYHIGFAVAMSGAFPLAGWLVSKLPDRLLALPNKDYWLAQERRAGTMAKLRGDLGWLGIVAGGVVLAVDDLLIDAAVANKHGIAPQELTRILLIAGCIGGFILLRLLLRFRRPPEAPSGNPPSGEQG